MSRRINDGKTPQERYDKANTVPVTLKLNRKYDADLLEWLEGQKAQGIGKQTAIKDALRKCLKTL